MKSGHRLCSLFLIILGATSCTSTGYNTAADPGYKVHIKHIDTRSLIGLLADISHTSIIVSDELDNQPYTIKASDTNALKLMKQAIQHANLTYKSYNDIMIAGSKCRLDNQPSIDATPALQKPLSVNFPKGTSLGHLMELYSGATQQPINIANHLQSAIISLRISTKPVRDQLAAIAIAEGLTSSKNIRGALNIYPDPKMRTCSDLKLHSSPTDLTDNPPAERGRSCLKKTKDKLKKRFCEPAENYALSQLKLMGYIQNNLNPGDIKAIIDTRYETMALATGNHLGLNSGLITKIDNKGIYIEELIPHHNTYHSKKQFIPY